MCHANKKISWRLYLVTNKWEWGVFSVHNTPGSYTVEYGKAGRGMGVMESEPDE
jgi:hypothetical protein